MKNLDVADALWAAYQVAISRSGDVTTEDGEFATVEITELINLCSSLSKLFETESDEVVYSDSSTIRNKLEEFSK